MENNNIFIKRILFSILGIVLLSLGIAITKCSLLGMDTYTGMNSSVASFLGISLGNYQLIVNVFLLIIMFIFEPKLLGIGTIINMVFVGYIIELFLETFRYTNIDISLSNNIVFKFVILFIGTLILCFGASMYIITNLGVSPYDSLAIIISNKINILSFAKARIITDIICVLIGSFVGIVLGDDNFGKFIGIGTIFITIVTGPMIEKFNKVVVRLII